MILPGQENWRWCRQCQGLFYAGAGTFGRCAAGPGGHTNAGSGNYRLTSGPSALGQHGWRWCRRCQSMFFSNATAASCADGGLHDGTASGDYVIASID